MQLNLSCSNNYFAVPADNPHVELTQQIKNIIDELAEKMHKCMVSDEQKTLVKYKDELVGAQKKYRDLQQKRSEQVIKDQVTKLKKQKQKTHHQQSNRAQEMTKLYQQLKIDLKRQSEYHRELGLQINFLNKQCAVARNRSRLLDQEIQELTRHKSKPCSLNFSSTAGTLPQINKRERRQPSQHHNQIVEKRLKNKIEYLQEYLTFLNHQTSEFQSFFNFQQILKCKSQRQKLALIEQVFTRESFKKYLYDVMYPV